MKKVALKTLAVLLLSIVFSSCKDKTYRTYMANVPIYLSEEEWRETTFELGEPQELVNPGKIYTYNSLLLINEHLKGVHFFDNSNPSSPINLGFLEVLASVDMAVKNDILYVDSYYDLLSFNITDPSNPFLVDRDEDIFSFSDDKAYDSYNVEYPMGKTDPTKGVIVGWELEEVTELVSNGGYNNQYIMEDSFASNSTSTTTSPLNSIGKGGSTSRFGLQNDYLYTLEEYKLGVINISNAANPIFESSISMSRFCETIFPAQDHLFIGTRTGMLVYSIISPPSPVYISEFNHINSCDPVVVDGNRAYVTLSSGRDCWGTINSLDVLDINDITSPELITSYTMTSPKGLGIDNDLLFLCDGDDGLKVFDRSNDTSIDQNLLNTFPAIQTFDVIPNNGTLIMTGQEGIYQYDYSDVNNIYELSLISVK